MQGPATLPVLDRRSGVEQPTFGRGSLGRLRHDFDGALDRVRRSEYVVVGGSRRFRAVQRRRTRAASRIGFLVVAAAVAFDALALTGLQGDRVRISIGLDVLTIVAAIAGWWAVGGRLARRPELLAWAITIGVALSTVLTEIATPSLSIQSVGYLLVLPGLVALVMPWRTRVHVRWLVVYALIATIGLAIDPGSHFTPAEEGDLVVVLFVALGASLAGHVLLQSAQIRSFAQLDRIRSLRRLADAEMVELERAHHALELTARTDALTGARNRRRLEEDLRAVRAHIDRSGMRYGLLMIDLDHFKAVNDRRGHLAGDEVLRRVVEAIEGSVRADDGVYRYGGEEFLVILSVPSRVRLLRAAARLRTVVTGLGIEHPDNQPWGVVSVSIGATLLGRFNLDLSTETWIAHTDAALYAAKRRGRNCVRFMTDRPIPAEGWDELPPADGDDATVAEGSDLPSRAPLPGSPAASQARIPRRRYSD